MVAECSDRSKPCSIGRKFTGDAKDADGADADAAVGARVVLKPAGQATTKQALDDYIKELEEKLSSVGDDAQLANVDLQNQLQKQQQTIQMMSNISKMLHDTALAIIRKIGS